MTPMDILWTSWMDRFQIDAMMKVRDEIAAREEAERKAREPIDHRLQVFRDRFAQLVRDQNS